MAQGLIQVSGFPIESYHSVFNRNSNVLLKRTNRMVKRNLKKISVQTGILQSLLSDDYSPVKVSGTLTIILLTSPREEHRRPTWVFARVLVLTPYVYTRGLQYVYQRQQSTGEQPPRPRTELYPINISNKGIKQTTR